MSGVFLTGTDTDAGKTIATLLLTHALRRRGVDACPYKPVQSGAEERDGKLIAPDAEVYHLLSELKDQELSTYLYKMASSPHLAAEQEGVAIPIEAVRTNIQEKASQKEIVLVEGAGGLYVPLTRSGYCMIDLMEELKFPVIIAAKASLGTINHTMMTVESLKNRGLHVAGIILSSTVQEDEAIESDNRQMIEQLTGVPIIGTIPFIPNISNYLADESARSEITKNWNIKSLQEVLADGYEKTI
ncbi:dethiobiotin synthase [Bacillus sp. REN10]|uniref:dethiobiotin synthase n=1 Tax=Bacillus sp. REN10 TaxID=2782541 RepID=UPI00193AE762|nr:dethiobiotin synthase [Bacillus sp. REN10]